MTSRQWRLSLGTLLVLAVAGILAADRALGRPLLTPVVIAALGAAALGEYLAMSRDRIPAPLRIVALVAGVALLLLPALLSALGRPVEVTTTLAAFPFVLAFALALAWLALRWIRGVEPGDLGAYGTSYVGVVVIAAPLYLLSACLWFPGEAEMWLLTVILGSKLNDIGGYLVGSTWGRRRICPGISPNKTWEGSLAGLALGVGGSLYLVTLVDPSGERLTPLRAVVLGLALGVTTQLSDTFESAMKRSARVKDSATFIPAFGGILDVVDSLIFAAPVGYTLGVWWLS